MQHPHWRWEGCRGDPWVSGFPRPARAREHEHADKAEHRKKTLKLWLGETRVTGRKLHGLQSNAHRSMEGLSLQRLTARWTRATSASPALPNEGREGMRGPPTSRSNVLCACTAGWPTGRKFSGHRVVVVVRGWENQPQGEGPQVEDDSRGRGCDTRHPEAVHRAHWRAV